MLLREFRFGTARDGLAQLGLLSDTATCAEAAV